MQWLQQLFEWITCWIPRICLVNPDEAGVRVTLGSRVRFILPGWYIWLPLIQECTVVTVTPQVVDLRAQSVLTRDGRDMCFGGGIMYRIKDAGRAILKVNDFDKSLQTVALGVISRYISYKEFNDCRDINDIEDTVLKGVKEHARGWGLDIMRVYVTDLGTARNLRILTDRAMNQLSLVTEEME